MLGLLLSTWVSLSVCQADPTPADELAARLLQLQQLEQTFESVAERVAASVVAIRCLRDSRSEGALADHTDTNHATAGATWGAGSGFIIRSDGLILTNEHVIAGAREITVVLPGGQHHPARVRATYRRGDLAVIAIDPDGLPPATLGDADWVRRGQWTMALGNPYGLSMDGQATVSIGVVGAVQRSLPELGRLHGRCYDNMIQTTADMNLGHSGGPLVDMYGRVVGINTAIFSRTGLSESVGFAIPMSRPIKAVVSRLLAGESIEDGYLGVWASAVPPRDAKMLQLPPDQGVRIWRVEHDSPAEHAGLRSGDIILTYHGTPVESGEHLARLVCQTAPGMVVNLETLRDRRRVRVQVEICPHRPVEQLAAHVDGSAHGGKP